MTDVYRKTTLPNGIRLLTEELPEFQSVSLGLWLNAGSRDEEAAENGLAHFLEHMAFKGTPSRTTAALAREIDQLGGSSNAFTTRENTCFHGRVLAGQLPKLFDLLSDLILHPLYDPEELLKEREVVIQEIHTHEDTPDDYVHTLFTQTFWGDCSFGRPIMGEAETVRHFSRDDLLAFRRDAYRPERLVVAASGRLRHEALVELVERQFSTFTNGRPPRQREAAVPQSQSLVFDRDLEQAHLVWGAPAPAAGDLERFPAILLNLILGGNMSSRLFQEVRENLGLCYSIYSFLHCYSDTGLLGLSASVSPDNLPLLEEVLLRELDLLARQPVSPDELQAAQEYIHDSFLLAAEDNDNRMLRLAKNELNFGRYIPLEELIDHLLAVTPDDIHALAQKLLPPENWHRVCLGAVA